MQSAIWYCFWQKEEEVEDDYTLDTSKVKAFFVPAGTMIEVYATTLHYAPCQTSDKGFRCVVVLPEGTNGELSHKPENKSGEEKLWQLSISGSSVMQKADFRKAALSD